MSDAIAEHSRIRRVALAMTCIAVLAAVVSMVVPYGLRRVFALQYFYFPVLWIVWLGAVIYCRGEGARYWWLLWLLIDGAVLITFLSLHLGAGPPYGNGQGADVAAMVAYIPVIVPTAFLIYTLPEGVQHAVLHAFDSFAIHFDTSNREAVKTWIGMSGLALVQSVAVFVAARLWRRRGGAAAEPAAGASKSPA